jgi:hypothetical protein
MKPEKEIFVPVTEEPYNIDYEVSNIGNIRSKKRNIIMRQQTKVEYKMIGLSYRGVEKKFYVHVLVAKAFVENPNNWPQVNHLNGKKEENWYTNLEWVTQSGNTLHSIHVLGHQRKKSPVRQLDMNGNLIATFNSIKEASLANKVDTHGIRYVCNGTRKQAGGFKWEYVDGIPLKEPAPIGKELEEYPNYIITSDGRVYSKSRQRFKAIREREGDYATVNLNGETHYVHILVAKLFLQPVPEKPNVNHKDRVKTNKDISNLEWVTQSENMIHAYKNGANRFMKAVIMYDKKGTEIKRYDSVRAAAKDNNINEHSIAAASRGVQHTSGGYIWKYA